MSMFGDSGVGGGFNNAYKSAKKGDVGGTAYQGTRASMDPFNVGGSAQKGISQTLGYDHSKQDDLNDQGYQMSKEESGKNRQTLGQMAGEDRAYGKSMQGAGNDYLGDIANARTDSVNQARDARNVYSGDIQPRMKNIMEDAQRQAGSAMSLADAGDPNNSVHRSVRGMYDARAQNAHTQGVADFGIMSALGNQSTMNTMGAGGPMTGSQMQLLSAGNQQQAAGAFSRAQQRMDNLKQQGIERGFDESSKQYDRGQQAKDRYAGSVGNYEGAMNRNIDRERSFRDETMGYDSDKYGVRRGMGGEKRDINNGIRNREMAQTSAEYGNQQGYIANQMAAANAENASRRGILGGVVQGAATGAGGYMGGAQGAQAGATAGGGINQGMQQGQGSYQPYSNTNRQQQRAY